MNRRITALTLIAVAALGLTACTAGTAGSASTPASAAADPSEPSASGDGTQTVAEGCAIVQQTITDATKEFEDAGTKDPAAVVDAMRAATDKLGAAATQVTNEEVAALLPELEDMFSSVADVMQAIIDGDTSKIKDLTALGKSFQETSQQFQDLCTS